MNYNKFIARHRKDIDRIRDEITREAFGTRAIFDKLLQEAYNAGYAQAQEDSFGRNNG